MLTRVGDEHNGRFVRETLAAEGVDVSHVKTDPKRLTALVFLGIQDRETFPLVFYRDNCADMAIWPPTTSTPPSSPRPPPCCCRARTCRSRAPTKPAARRWRWRAQHGTRVVLDIDYRPVLWGLTSPGMGEQRFVAIGPGQRAPADRDRRVRPGRRHRGGNPHRRRQHRHAAGIAPPARADHAHCWWSSAGRWAAWRSTARSRPASKRACKARASRSRCSTCWARAMPSWRASCAAGCATSRCCAAAPGPMPAARWWCRATAARRRWRAGRSCSTSSRTARPRGGCARTRCSSTCTAPPPAHAAGMSW